MEDTERTGILKLLGLRTGDGPLCLQFDRKAASVRDPAQPPRFHISLKARMLGGQAEKIMRLRGLMR